MASKSYDRPYQNCVNTARDMAGGARAFQIIGSSQRQAYVAEAILTLLDQQDDEFVSDATVRILLSELRDRLTSDETLL